MKSYNHLPFDRAAAPTEQQQATDAIHTSSSKALPPWCSLKIRPLAKTIFVPLMIFLVFTNLVIPVAAMDNQISLATYPLQNTHDVFTANPPPRLPIRIPLTTIVTMAIFVVGYMMTMARQMLGPLMGVASIMSFILRNDAAVRPSISWAYVASFRFWQLSLILSDRIFGILSLATMMYLRHQTRRVKFDSL